MLEYRVHKVLNNNAVISEDDSGNEIIITGNGIGYGVGSGGKILEQRINRIYEPKSKGFVHQFSTLISEIPFECFTEAEDIKDMAENELNQKLDQNLILALADHISFALGQYREGKERPILEITEMKQFYNTEYHVGEKAVKMIEKRFSIECESGEAAAFTFHIINAELGGGINDANKIMSSISDILNIIQNTMQVKFQEDSLDYSRMIIHLKFFLKRVLIGDTKDDEQFGPLLINSNEGAFKGIGVCLNAIGEYMKDKYQCNLTETERVYLLIHIARNTQSQRG